MMQEKQTSRSSQDTVDKNIAAFFSAFEIKESVKASFQNGGQLSLSRKVLEEQAGAKKAERFIGLKAIKQVAVRWLISFPTLHSFYLNIVKHSEPAHQLQSFALDKSEVRTLFDNALNEFIENRDRIKFLVPEKPVVSVVVAVYNQPGLLLQTLIYLHRASSEIELVLVDNASDLETKGVISRVDGAKLIVNQENLGFLKAANQGAREANGEYLLFLNSDCLVFPSAIQNAVDYVTKNSNFGALGARIIKFNGLLQEAGCEVLSDGSCIGLGRGCEPNADQYTYARSVDFCSGAFLITPRQLFLDCGLFDEAYAPAYFEEVDYCARLLGLGLDVIYLPSATVLHYEFGSEEKKGDAVTLQINNRHTFLRKHHRFLKQKASTRLRLRGSNRAGRDHRVLVIDDRVPHTTSGAGSPRCKAIIEELNQAGALITFFSTSTVKETLGSVYRTIPYNARVVRPAGLSKLGRFLIEEGACYDQIIVSRPLTMQAAWKALKRLKRKANEKNGSRPFIVYDAEAIFSDRLLLRAKLFDQRYLQLLAILARRWELGLIRAADLVWAVSPNDAQRIESQSGVRTIELGHLLTPRRSGHAFKDRRDFLFVGFLGRNGSPNVDSLLWFCEQIWPRIRSELGSDVRMLVAGEQGASSLSVIEDDSVCFLGALDSLEALYDRSRVFVAPTRFAAGVPHKVHEAAANGVPTIVTELLCGQLRWRKGSEILAAGNEVEFANQCIRLYRDEELWKRVREGGFEAVSRDCSPDRFRASIRESIALAISES